ncbi:hypothetical protein BX666DRAFT_706177 [Dichotomocladium elegans]|nr:hypothetical protein BX666DRAFT_706177 [Dichotomocladium elegans]
MPASPFIAQNPDAYRSEHLIPQESLIAPEEHSQKLNATAMRCSTTNASVAQSEDDNDNTSDSLSTEALSAQSLDSFSMTSVDSSSEDHVVSSVPVTLDRIFRDNLSVEMLMLYEELLPSRESYERRRQLIQKIERLLNDEWPNRDIRVHLFGSSANDLGTTHSDVDLCITTPWNGLRNVRTLARLFGRCGMQHVVCVPRAKVPIVRLFDPETQLACDINVNNTLALQNTKMIKTYVALDSRVRPLIMLIKYWTKQRRLNDAANGGTLSTYTWTCMVINFLQMREPPILPVLHQLSGDKDDNSFFTDVDTLQGFGIANEESLGGLLYAFFRRYAIEFDYDEQVVSVRHGQYLSKEEKGWNTGRNKQSFCVEEPFNTTRNLGNSADQESVRGLVVEFQRACFLLANCTSLDLVCEPYVPSPNEPRSPLPPTSGALPPPQPSALNATSPTPARRISNAGSRSVHPMDASHGENIFTTLKTHIPHTQATGSYKCYGRFPSIFVFT